MVKITFIPDPIFQGEEEKRWRTFHCKGLQWKGDSELAESYSTTSIAAAPRSWDSSSNQLCNEAWVCYSLPSNSIIGPSKFVWGN